MWVSRRTDDATRVVLALALADLDRAGGPWQSHRDLEPL